MGIAVYRRYVDAMEGRPSPADERLPPLPRDPMIGADSSAAAMVEIARRDPVPVDVRRAHDLLAEVDRRGGVLTGTFVTLVPRALGVAADLLGNEDEAMTTLERAIAVGRTLGAEPERARAQVDLATVLLRRGDRDRAHGLLDEAGATFEQLGMGPDAERVDALSGGSPRKPGRDGASGTARTAVILFADIVDSTRLTEELGDQRYRERAKTLEDRVNATIVAHEGTVVPGVNLGDGFIGLFPSAQRAIAASRRCAQESMATDLHLHLAVHGGEIIVDGPRIFGGAVNRAARICSLTGPDEVLVSEMIRDQAEASGGDVAFIDRGEHVLKGIAEPQRLWAVVEPAPVGAPIG